MIGNGTTTGIGECNETSDLSTPFSGGAAGNEQSRVLLERVIIGVIMLIEKVIATQSEMIELGKKELN